MSDVPSRVVLSVLSGCVGASLISAMPDGFGAIVGATRLPVRLGPTRFTSYVLAYGNTICGSGEICGVPRCRSITFPTSAGRSVLVVHRVVNRLSCRTCLGSVRARCVFMLPASRTLGGCISPISCRGGRGAVARFVCSTDAGLDKGHVGIGHCGTVRGPSKALAGKSRVHGP